MDGSHSVLCLVLGFVASSHIFLSCSCSFLLPLFSLWKDSLSMKGYINTIKHPNDLYFHRQLSQFLHVWNCNISFKHSDEVDTVCSFPHSPTSWISRRAGCPNWMRVARWATVKCNVVLSSEVTSSTPSIFTSLYPFFLMRKLVCKAIAADYPRYYSNSFVAWGTTGVSSLWMLCLSEWASHFPHHILWVYCLIWGLPVSLLSLALSANQPCQILSLLYSM